MTSNEAVAPAAAVNGRTPAEWEALAVEFEAASAARYASAAESFERCDTDGYLSQWASETTGREYRAKAAWARNHGYVTISALLSTDGATLVSFRTVVNRYGTSWLATDAGERVCGKRFLNDSNARTDAKRLANNRRKGFTLGQISVPGYVKLDGTTAINVAPRSFPDRERVEAGEWPIVEAELLLDRDDR